MSITTCIREKIGRHAVLQSMVIAPDPDDVMVDQHLQALDMDAAWAAKQEDAA